MSKEITIEGQIGDLFHKERYLIPRTCHIKLKRLKAIQKFKSPKTITFSICLNKNKSTIKSTSTTRTINPEDSITIGINFILTYLHHFKDINNTLTIRIH